MAVIAAPGQPALLDVRAGRTPAGPGALAARAGAAAFTGAATLSIPIEASPARGLAPELSLDYSSQAGDGVFGLGFALSLAAVQRRTNQRIPRYDDADTFALGDEPLTRLVGQAATRQAGGISYQVTRYARRSAATVARIERWSAAGGGFWRSIDPDGLVTVYGVTADARIADPADPGRVFAWLPQASYDASGCAIAFGYQREDGTGVPDIIYERNRSRSANRYLRSVSYGNQTPFSPRSPADRPPGPWHLEVVCDYGEYDFTPANDTPYRPVRPWPARELPFSDYSAGFERRTHRLCRAIALFHRFPELGQEPVLVRTLTLSYDVAGSGGLATHLVAAQARGHRYTGTRPPGERYWVAAEAPVSFGYVTPSFACAQFAPLLTQAEGVPPVAAQTDRYCVADLDGQGVAGVVYADSRTMLYWRPTVDPADPDGPVRFVPDAPAPVPVERQVAGGYYLGDVTGDGRLSLIADTAGRAGFYGRAPGGGWQPFTAFSGRVTDGGVQTSPAGGYSQADLTGNGLPDLVRLAGPAVIYAPNLGQAGYGGFRRATRRVDMPAAVTSAPRAAVRFAGVLGGGEQLVLVQSGRLICWPSLGYGVFGEPVQPGGVPRFDDVPEDQVFLGDLTGTGTADLILVRPARVDIYLNLGGNTFAARPVTVTTPVAAHGTVTLADVTADGRPSVVFSTAEPQPRHYALTLCPGLQPFCLNEVDDGAGRWARLGYSTTARMRLQDTARGEPWQLDLPFPVPVVTRIDEDDEISAVRTTTSYRYRDGYFDPAERVFTGFARVDERAAETGVLPALTRTWYHTGAFAIDGLNAALEREYFSGDPDAYPMPGPAFEWGGVVPDGGLLRQAHAALAGTPRRTEVYGADGPVVPYQVSQSELTARLLAPPAGEHAAFLVHEREAIGYRYETEPGDPAVQHMFTLEVDDYGDVLRTCAVSYRRRDEAAALPGQDRTVVMAALTDYLPARDEADLLLFGQPRQTRSYAITGIDPPAVRGGRYYDTGQIAAQIARALRGEAPASAELMAADRVFYQGADGGLAPPEQVAAPPRVIRRDVAVFTGAQISGLLAGVPLPVTLEAFLAGDGGYEYEAAAGLWWQPGSSVFYDPALFWQPRLRTDPVASLHPGQGATLALGYDPAAIAVVETVLGAADGSLLDQRSSIEVLDYQTLRPQRTRDPNGIVTDILYDPLGRVFATAFRGEVWVDGAARQVGFGPLPLGDPASWPQPGSLAELTADPAAFLGGAATFTYHDRLGWRRDGTPPATAAVAAVGYPRDPADPRPGPARPGPARLSVRYCDAGGLPVQVSVRAAADDGTGQFQWTVTDRVRYTGPGLPLQVYVPFFASTAAFVPASELVRSGMGPVTTYDPAGRPLRTDYPQGSFARAFYATTSYDSWSVTIADPDDTVTTSPYYEYYIDGGNPLPARERAALLAAAQFADTPTTWHTGVLGGAVARDQLLTPALALRSAYRYDDAGRPVSAADPRQAAAGRINLAFGYGLTREPVRTASADAGTGVWLADAAGAPLLSADGRGVVRVTRRDALHRTAAVLVTAPDPVTVQLSFYGDTLDPAGEPIYGNPAQRGLIGRLCVRYDQAGRHEVAARAPAGQPLSASETFAADITSEPDWQPGEWTSWAELFAAESGRLEAASFGSAAWYGPLGEPLTGTDPGGNTRAWGYDPAGAVSRVDLGVGGDPASGYADGIAYNAAGALRHLRYVRADGSLVASREFSYDPATLRLTGMRGIRQADGAALQDLSYVYDPAGNLTAADDPAAPGAGSGTDAGLGFGYDALYRIAAASGRAVTTLSAGDAASGRYDGVYQPLPEPSLARYTASFAYDESGNCVRQGFSTGHDDWATTLTPAGDSNRATPGEEFDPAGFDESGNVVRLPTIPGLAWDYNDALRAVTYQGSPGGATGAEHHAYDATGARRRRLATAPDGQVTDVRYFPGLAIVRQLAPDGSLLAEYQRLRLNIPDQSLGEVLRWTAGQPPPGVPAVQRRYLLDNRTGSAMLELSDEAAILSYEEYSPFGATVFATGPDLDTVALKAYRYIGRERDQTSGLAYHGARYYASWLARWISPDPAGAIDGLNLYAYAASNPATYLDPTGLVRMRPRPPRYRRDPVRGRMRRVPRNYRLPRELRDIRDNFGIHAARQVWKSGLLYGRLRQLVGNEWRIKPALGTGSLTQRSVRQIQVRRPSPLIMRDFLGSLSHEVGHASYQPPPEHPWSAGTSKAEYIAENVKLDLMDEANATMFNLEVKDDYEDEGISVGIAGLSAAAYQIIYDQYVAGNINRAQALTGIASQYGKGEITGTTNEPYNDYFYKKYSDKWRKKWGPNLDVAP